MVCSMRQFVRRLGGRGLRGTLVYTLGRFHQVREAYGERVGLAQRYGAVPGLSPVEGSATMFSGDAEMHARSIARDSAAFGFRLPDGIIAGLRKHAEGARIKDWSSQEFFSPAEVVDGRRNGKPVFVADVMDTEVVPEAIKVARDPLVLDVVSRHMRYTPVGVHIRMLRSFVVDAPIEERRKTQTVDYHFDVHGYNFVYANFYLCDVDTDRGAHEMVLGSHRDKPFRWLLGSARKSDEEIIAHYPAAKIKTILGPAGTGFIQDSSCYHRVLAPKTKERLMLHLRYY